MKSTNLATLFSIAALSATWAAGLALAQSNPSQSPGSRAVTSPSDPNAPASQGGTTSGTGGVTQGELIDKPATNSPANGSTGAGEGTAGQSNVPGETGSHEQDNRGVPASPNTQGQD